jgi:hypothetical protein
LGSQEGVRQRKEVKIHKEKTEQKLVTEVELDGGASPEEEEEEEEEEDEEEEEEEEESSISSTSKPVTDIKVTATVFEHVT